MRKDRLHRIAHLLSVSLPLLALPLPAHAAETWQLRVSAGQLDRREVPVRISLHVPERLSSAKGAVLHDATGRTITGQWTAPALLSPPGDSPQGTVLRDLHFVLPHLEAGQSLVLTARVADVRGGFRWQNKQGLHAELTHGGRPVLRYMYEALDSSSEARRGETYKVYHHVYDPTGERLVTKGPGGRFPHHRGLFYGYNRIRYGDGRPADIWHCRNGEHQSHEKFLTTEEGPVLGRHRVAIDWHGRDGDVFAKEQREVSAYGVAGGRLIEVASRLVSTVGKVQLDGDPQHAGFQFRASQHVPDHTAHLTYYLRPDGKDKPGSFRNWPQNREHANLPWNAMSFVVDGSRYTCCYLDHPDNPKEARYSERDYGRFGSYFPYQLDHGRALEIRYRFWLQEGEMDVQEVERHSRNFVDPPRLVLVSGP